MKRPFIVEIDKIQSLDSIYLSKGSYTRILDEYLGSNNFNIYFISHVEKFRFDLDACCVKHNKLIVHFLKRNVYYTFPEKNISYFDKSSSSSRSLTLFTEDGKSLILTVNEFMTNYCSDFSRNQEITYIGQSKSIANRLENHEKLIQAFASLSDDKEVLINFIKPSFGYIDKDNNHLIQFNKETIESTIFNTFSYQDLIDLTERILVQFFQPTLNTNFIKTDFSKDKVVLKIKEMAKNDVFLFSNKIERNGYDLYSTRQLLNSSTFILNSRFEFEKYEA